MSKRVLHVINASFVTSYFFGEQFKYLKLKTGNIYYLACTPSDEHTNLASKLDYIPVNIPITRSINPLIDLKSIIKLYQFMKEKKIDVVIGHTPKGGMIAMIAASLAGIDQRIYFRHGIMYETSKGFKRFLLKSIEKLTGNLANTVVCVSESVKKVSIKDKLNAPNKNIILGLGTCNGIDVTKFNKKSLSIEKIQSLKNQYQINDSDFVIGFVGRLVNDKGVSELVQSFDILCQKYQNIKLLLVGPFEERDSVSDEIKKNIETNSAIIHTGLVNNTALFFSMMHVLILPTYREGFPTVVLEASAMELPIIITKATGCTEAIVDGETGTFISHDINNIANVIETYIKNPEKGIEQGKKGRKFVVNNFEQTLIWEKIQKQLKY